MIRPVSYVFMESVDHRTDHFLLRSSLYDGLVVRSRSKCKNWLDVAMKSSCINSSDPSPSCGSLKRSRVNST